MFGFRADPAIIKPCPTPVKPWRPKWEPGGRRGYRVRVRRRTEAFLQRRLIAERVNTWGEVAERLLAEAALRDLLLEPVEIDVSLAAKKKKTGGTGGGVWVLTRTIYVRLVPPVERFLAGRGAHVHDAASAYLEGLRIAEAGR